MKDKRTDLAAGRLGRPPGPQQGGELPPPATGNYGIGRLGIIPPGARSASRPADDSPRARPAPGVLISAPDEPVFLEPPPPSAPRPRRVPAGGGRAAPVAAPRSEWEPQTPAQFSLPVGLWERARQWVRARPALAAGACMTIVLCGVLGLIIRAGSGGGVPQSASAEPPQAATASPASPGGAAAERAIAASASPAPRAVGPPAARSAGGPTRQDLPAAKVPEAPLSTSPPTEQAPAGPPRRISPEADPQLAGLASESVGGTRGQPEDWGSRPPRPSPAPSPAPAALPAAAGTGGPPPQPHNVGYKVSSGLVVSAILRGTDGPLAIINNELVKPGGTVGGATVVRIGEFAVELEADGERFLVSLCSSAPPAQAAPIEETDPAPAETPRETPTPRRSATQPARIRDR